MLCAVGFLACTLLLTHPPPSLSLLLEEYDLPSLGAAEVEWRELFSGIACSFTRGRVLILFKN